jgi:hypothetical protein
MGELSPAARLGGVLLGAVPMLRPTRYRLRLRHPDAARVADAMADRVLPLLVLLIVVLAVVGLLPGQAPALRLFWLGSAFGLLTGLPYVHERRGLRRRLRELPPPADPVDELCRAMPDDPAARALAAGDAQHAAALAAERDRDDPAGLRAGAMAAALLGDARSARARALRAVQVEPPVWEVPAETGLHLCRRGGFGEGVRLLERAVEVSGGAARAELMLAQGLALAGRLRDAAEAFDRAQGRPPRRRPGQRY